jgi:hypothetical protein
MEKTAADYSNEIAELDKEVSEAIRVKEEVHQAILDLRRKRIELDSARSKAAYNLDMLKVKRSLLVHAFYNAKNSGL